MVQKLMAIALLTNPMAASSEMRTHTARPGYPPPAIEKLPESTVGPDTQIPASSRQGLTVPIHSSSDELAGFIAHSKTERARVG